jgi:two-component system NarL family sensor kinase
MLGDIWRVLRDIRCAALGGTRMLKLYSRTHGDVARPLVRFVLAGLITVTVVGALAVAVQVRVARSDALRDARTTASLAGHGIVEPNVTRDLLMGDPAAIVAMDRIVRRNVIGDGIVRVKVWDRNGTIVYSDQAQLIGKRFVLPEDERAALRTGNTTADLSDLRRSENRYEIEQKNEGQQKLLEVYLPIHARTGDRLLFEVYVRASAVARGAKTAWLAFAPGLLGALLLLQLLQLPLASSMAKRLQRARQEREALLTRALAASDIERRRIAGDLHDGVVQQLVGTSFALTAAADRVGTGDPDATRRTLRDAAAQTRSTIRELRSMLVEIYPPDLHRAGLESALSDLVAPLKSTGLDTQLEVPPGLRLEPDKEALIFRTAQEALRNVASHAQARRVEVGVTVGAGTAGLAIADDGKGFSPEDAENARAHGHLGLKMLADMARDAGGRLDVLSAPGHGTRLQLEVPV